MTEKEIIEACLNRTFENFRNKIAIACNDCSRDLQSISTIWKLSHVVFSGEKINSYIERICNDFELEYREHLETLVESFGDLKDEIVNDINHS